MKHSFVLLMAILAAANLSAQVYVSGGIGVRVGTSAWGGNLRDYGGTVNVTENNQVSISPEIGYAFNDWLSMGTSVSFLWKTPDVNQFTVTPYVRGTLPLGEHLGLFLDVLYSYCRDKREDYSSNMMTGLAPGIKIPITPRCGLTSRLAFIGLEYVPLTHLRFFEAHTTLMNSGSISFYYILK